MALQFPSSLPLTIEESKAQSENSKILKQKVRRLSLQSRRQQSLQQQHWLVWPLLLVKP
jgi:hypothetical protein